MSGLTTAMGHRSESYAAFDDEQRLSTRSVERYTSGPGAIVANAMLEPTAPGP